MHLFLEVAVLDHAGELHQAAQRDLSPASAHLGPPQCLDEVLRLLSQHLLVRLHGLELRANASIRLAAGLFQLRNLPLRLLQGIANRLDQVLDRLLAIAEFALGPFVLRAEVLLGQAQERLAVGLQRLVGEVGKCGSKPAGGGLEGGVPLDLQRVLVLDAVFEADDFVPLPIKLPAQDQPGDEAADCEADQKARTADLDPNGVDLDAVHQVCRLTAFCTIVASSRVSVAM
mgnify:CR=1 FL=1